MIENFVFSSFNKQQTEEIVNSSNKRENLRKVMKFSKDNEKDEILLDFFENLLNFCLSKEFTLEKVSCCLGILNHLIQHSIKNSVLLTTSQDRLKSLLKKHSIQRPPFGIQVFSSVDIVSIQEYTERTFFKHYFLFADCFTPHKDVIITTERLYCAKFPLNSSLNEGSEINPETVFELKNFLPRTQTPKEAKQELRTKEEDSESEQELDPLQQILNSEIKAIKSLIEEKVKKQDEEIFAKIELLKK
jgi:hypothetical protein